jgi:S-(hydroxymethyl)glutathione dehydrogenase/alcohol dehydrogenase
VIVYGHQFSGRVVRTRGAVVFRTPGIYEVTELELDDPRQGELRVRMVAAGLCHSDDHYATGDKPAGTYPWCGGHEGAGVVEEVGPNTPGWAPGDHVIFSFLPACGKCRWCATGRQNLCDLGAGLLTGGRLAIPPDDPPSFRLHLPDGTPVGQMCSLGTFSEFTTVSVDSAIKVAEDLDLARVCLLACAVGTGFGSAVHVAGVRPGETVIVMGTGGIGMNAVQGAASAGAAHVIAVDPVAFKRDKALEFGATRVFGDIADAADFARSVTNGQGADSAIVTVGVLRPEHVAQAFAAIRKAGTVVVTALGDADFGIPVSLTELTVFQKRIQGVMFGGCNPVADIPLQIGLYRAGKLKVDELVTAEYALDEIAKGYDDLRAGRILRGILRF